MTRVDMTGVGVRRAQFVLGAAGVAHDAVIAPVAVLLGLAVFAVAPRRLLAPMRVAALAVVSVVLIGLPLLMTR